MKKDKKSIILIIIVFILVVLDQGFKLYSSISLKENVNTSDIITYEDNSNEIGHNNIVSYVITNIIVLGIIIKFFVNQKDRIGINLVVVISFLIAGAISNLIDKIAIGIIVNYIKLFNLPAINLSYIYIIIGWIGLAAIFAWGTYKEFKEKQEAQKNRM